MKTHIVECLFSNGIVFLLLSFGMITAIDLYHKSLFA